MRIMQVHNRYRSDAPSGENRVVDSEAEALAALGHEVTRFERCSDDIEQWSRARKASVSAAVVWNPRTRRDLRARLRAWQPEVVHLHNTFPLLSPSVLHACRDAGVPVVATIHNYKLACASGDFFRHGAVCHDCAGHLPVKAVVRGCYRDSALASAPVALATAVHRGAWRSLVSAYIFVSSSQARLLDGLRLPAERVFVRDNYIPRGDAPRGDAPRGDAPRRYAPRRRATLAPAEPMVLYAGRLDEAKGARLLMAGWDRYCATSARAGRGPGLRLVIAGSGPLAGDVAQWAAGRPSVQVAGQLDSAACSAAMAQARAVLVPSAWEETFGLVVVEAMAMGVPPIASGHGSLPGLITDGVDGALFRPGDAGALAAAISDVEADPARYRRYGEAARKTYESRFNPERNLLQLVDIYRYAVTNPI